jgi:hypothetical protein
MPNAFTGSADMAAKTMMNAGKATVKMDMAIFSGKKIFAGGIFLKILKTKF